MRLESAKSSGANIGPPTYRSRLRLRSSGSGTQQDRPMCVPELVAAQAAATADGTAIVAGEQVISYEELGSRSNRIACYLRRMGVDRGTLVTLLLPRSAALVVAALGVLKAGGAYVPFDPAYPQARLALMLMDAQPAVVITQGSLAGNFVGAWRTLEIDERGETAALPFAAAHSDEAIDCEVTPEQLAYVIYTSGSTGQPKGVQISHGALLNLVSWHHRAFGVTSEDRAVLLASPAFDASVWEMWPYLTAGASIHVPDDGIRSDPESLRDWLVSQHITIAFVPPTLAEQMLALKWPRKTALRVMLTGGDTLRRFPPSSLPFTLVNNYGPTECTVLATSGVVPPTGNGNELPSIGRPISNVQIHILDEKRQQVPQGVAGEIYIGGLGVARGYLNAPELTAAKFIASPLNSEPNSRLYKTGDLGRYLPDGQIAFLGRIDEQIKIRGHRIEPNEIVTALAQHPMVQASFVMAREDTPGDPRLTAYIVPQPGTHPTDNILREFLGKQLPDYSVPASFVIIDALPVNASGKIDRAALPAPGESNSLHFDSSAGPRTMIEQRIAEILKPLLKIKAVGIEDNFFMLGGHSLLGTQLIARTRDAFGVELSLRSVFQSPTIAGIASEVERLLYRRFETISDEEAERLVKGTARANAERI
jgi:amino acid adenylation domain-containing protein